MLCMRRLRKNFPERNPPQTDSARQFPAENRQEKKPRPKPAKTNLSRGVELNCMSELHEALQNDKDPPKTENPRFSSTAETSCLASVDILRLSGL